MPLVTAIVVQRHTCIISRNLAVQIADDQHAYIFIGYHAFNNSVGFAWFDWLIIVVPSDVK